jgi:hypothetical protein
VHGYIDIVADGLTHTLIADSHVAQLRGGEGIGKDSRGHMENFMNVVLVDGEAFRQLFDSGGPFAAGGFVLAALRRRGNMPL